MPPSGVYRRNSVMSPRSHACIAIVPGMMLLPGNLSQSTMNGLEENNDLAFEKAVLSMVSIKRDLSVTENTS
jgi:uncharacterized membrane protein YjjB (DUF3815 family)